MIEDITNQKVEDKNKINIKREINMLRKRKKGNTSSQSLNVGLRIIEMVYTDRDTKDNPHVR